MKSSLRAEEIAAYSRAALDREVTKPELYVVTPTTSAVLLGAFQRATEVAAPATTDPREADGEMRVRRGSGGGAVLLSPGVLYVGLLMPHPGALVPANEMQILNRAVRPVLRAISRMGVLTHYFGRDFLSSKKRPVASVSFGHDAISRRTLVETFISVDALAMEATRASFDGKLPATMAELRADTIDVTKLATALAEEHGLPITAPAPVKVLVAPTEPPWTARADESIGPLFAGPDHRGRTRLGGELMASRDRVAWLEERVHNAPDSAIGALVDEAFTPAGIALFGVKTLLSVRDVLLAARAASAAT